MRRQTHRLLCARLEVQHRVDLHEQTACQLVVLKLRQQSAHLVNRALQAALDDHGCCNLLCALCADALKYAGRVYALAACFHRPAIARWLAHQECAELAKLDVIVQLAGGRQVVLDDAAV